MSSAPPTVRPAPTAAGPADVTRALTTAASVSYLLGCALGSSVAGGLVDTRRIRWVHHALFGVTAALTAAASISAASISAASISVSARATTTRLTTRTATTGLALAGAGLGLARIAAVGAGDRRRHTRTALAPAPCYAAAMLMAWWGHGAAGRDSR